MDKESDAIAHLPDSRVGAEIPNRCCQSISSILQQWSEIVSLISPVRQIAVARATAHPLLVYIKNELVIRGHID